MAKKGEVVIGGACVVTAGPNKGKKGTYTVDDEGNVWCEGDWGGTQCATKCAPGLSGAAQVFDYASTTGDVHHEFDGMFALASGQVLHVRAAVDAKTKKPTRFSAVEIAPTPVADLKKSKSPIDRALADSIEAHAKQLRS